MNKLITEEEALAWFPHITHRLEDRVFSLGGIGALEIIPASNQRGSHQLQYRLYDEGTFEGDSTVRSNVELTGAEGVRVE